MSFFNELKRRNVVRVGLAYAIAGWVFLQVADLVLTNIEAPSWVIQALMLFVLLGFIAALVIAWAYEITPEGIKKESEVDRSQSIAGHTGKKLDRIIIGFLVLAVAVLLLDRSISTSEKVSGPISIQGLSNHRTESEPYPGPLGVDGGKHRVQNLGVFRILYEQDRGSVLLAGKGFSTRLPAACKR
jgi:hypothetical protein